jgi:hypothetical protein
MVCSKFQPKARRGTSSTSRPGRILKIQPPPTTTLLDGALKTIIIGLLSIASSNFFPSIAMTFRLTTGLAALGCVLLASCYPYNENPQKKQGNKPPKKTVTTAEQQKIKEQRDKMKEQEALAKKDEIKPETLENTGAPSNPVSDLPKPPAPEKRDFAFANKVPGKEGFVFSPYNNKVVDVRDIPSGTLVQDPTYPAAEKKYFRVP